MFPGNLCSRQYSPAYGWDSCHLGGVIDGEDPPFLIPAFQSMAQPSSNLVEVTQHLTRAAVRVYTEKYREKAEQVCERKKVR